MIMVNILVSAVGVERGFGMRMPTAFEIHKKTNTVKTAANSMNEDMPSERATVET